MEPKADEAAVSVPRNSLNDPGKAVIRAYSGPDAGRYLQLAATDVDVPPIPSHHNLSQIATVDLPRVTDGSAACYWMKQASIASLASADHLAQGAITTIETGRPRPTLHAKVG